MPALHSPYAGNSLDQNAAFPQGGKMPAPHHFLLLTSLLLNGGPLGMDGGTASNDAITDGGIPTRAPIIAAGIEWPDDVRPLATLDGPAVLAAHAALQQLLSSFPKESAGTCSHSAKAMEVVVGQEHGLYFVRINQRVEKCGGFAPGFNLTLDWFELYAVSPEGKVLARYPHQP